MVQHPFSTCSSSVNYDLGEWFILRSVQTSLSMQIGVNAQRQFKLGSHQLTSDLKNVYFFGNACKWSKREQSATVDLPDSSFGAVQNSLGRVRVVGGQWGFTHTTCFLLGVLPLTLLGQDLCTVSSDY